MTERFFDIWNKYVIGNKEDFKIGLSQLEGEIQADERTKTIKDLYASDKSSTLKALLNMARADERTKTIEEIEDIVDEINNQGFHCTDDYCDDDNHDCAECMAKAILGSLARMKSNAECEKGAENGRFST